MYVYMHIYNESIAVTIRVSIAVSVTLIPAGIIASKTATDTQKVKATYSRAGMDC